MTAPTPTPGEASPPQQSIPALIFWDRQTPNQPIAGLHALDRLIIALHRAGAHPITLLNPASAPIPSAALARTTALRIPLHSAPAAPTLTNPTLLATSLLHVQTNDIRQLLLHGGRLQDSRGVLLPIGLLPPGHAPSPDALTQLPPRPAQGIACPVTTPAEARQAADQLWNSLTSTTDGFVDRWFNRPAGRPLSKILVYTPISPNAVSLASVALGLLAAAGFALGHPTAAIAAALLFQASAIVDCIDGELARVAFKESPLGKWIDLVGDQIVHGAVFAGLALGAVRSGQLPAALGLTLGLSAVLGGLLAFAVVLRGLLRPLQYRNQRLQRFIDAATTRDFSVLVLLLACLHRLDWFVWMAAIGSHIFWIVALTLQRSTPSAARHP